MSLRQSNLIDLLALDPTTDHVVMTMVEPRPWDGSDQRVYELQEKVNAYLSFALDGELEEQIPQLKGKTVRLQLDCLQEPDEKMAHFIAIIQKQIAFQGIQFSVEVNPDIPPDNDEGCCGEHSHGHAEGEGCCGGHAHEHTEAEGCCGGHAHEHPHNKPAGDGCCGGSGGCGCKSDTTGETGGAC